MILEGWDTGDEILVKINKSFLVYPGGNSVKLWNGWRQIRVLLGSRTFSAQRSETVFAIVCGSVVSWVAGPNEWTNIMSCNQSFSTNTLDPRCTPVISLYPTHPLSIPDGLLFVGLR